MKTEDKQSVKTIEADVAKGDFVSARKETETMEARHTTDDCNMAITDIIAALANKDQKGTRIAIDDFEKWYLVDVADR